MPTSRSKRVAHNQQGAAKPDSDGGNGAAQEQPVLDLVRTAELVAKGEVAFPSDLSEQESKKLTSLVREQLRERMVRHIARQIVAEILGGAGQKRRQST